jgi:predicted secreted protein
MSRTATPAEKKALAALKPVAAPVVSAPAPVSAKKPTAAQQLAAMRDVLGKLMVVCEVDEKDWHIFEAAEAIMAATAKPETLKSLRAKCKAAGVVGYSSADRETLVKMLAKPEDYQRKASKATAAKQAAIDGVLKAVKTNGKLSGVQFSTLMSKCGFTIERLATASGLTLKDIREARKVGADSLPKIDSLLGHLGLKV